MKKFILIPLFIFSFVSIVTLHAQWQTIQTSTDSALQDISIVNPQIIWASGRNAIVRSVNGGQNWQNINVPTAGWIPHIFALSTDVAWCTGDFGDTSIFKTTNGGMSWTKQFYSPVQYINFIYFFGQNTGFLLTDPPDSLFGYFITRDGGNTWIRSVSGFTGGHILMVDNRAGALDTNLIWFDGWTSNGGRLFKLTGGLNSNWASYPFLNNSYMTHIVFKDINTALATNGSQVQITTNGGLNWAIRNDSALGISPPVNFVLVPNTDRIFATAGTKFRMSYDFCSTWQPPVYLSSSNYRNMRAIDTNNIYMAGNGGKIYKYNFNYIGIGNYSSVVSQSYLYQNHPNPFNAITRIIFDISKNALVKITIYDFLGRELEVLVNEFKNAGRYEVEFDGSNLASGVYFYRIEARDFIHSKKMILVK